MQKLNDIPNLSKEFRAVVLDKVKTKRIAKDDPTSAFQVEGLTIDPKHLAAYNQAVGARNTNEALLTYPFVLAFPVMMRVMTQPDFPYSAMGAVHLSNTITQTKPLTLGQEFNLTVHATNIRKHRRGVVVDMITTIDSDGETIWEQTSSFLGMGAKIDKNADLPDYPAPDLPPLPETTNTALWRVTQSDISQYADASGDKNPVHTSKLGAKVFGFPSSIAHGMWTAAKLLTLLEGRVRGKQTYHIDFAKPVILPAKIAAWGTQSPNTNAHPETNPTTTWDLQVRKARKPETLHAAATLTVHHA